MSLYPHIKIKETTSINIEGGYLIDGFPSTGVASAIATESIIQTSNFELAGIIDSDVFPPVSIIKNQIPNYPTRIFVNHKMKVGIFSSYLTLHQSVHRPVAKAMLKWAKQHKCALIVSSAGIKTAGDSVEIIAAANTKSARNKLKDAGITVLEHGTIPGIPGCLLNEGLLNEQDVAVLLFNVESNKPDLKSTTQLCSTLAKLVPGTACSIEALQKEAKIAEEEINEAEKETKVLKDVMYR